MMKQRDKIINFLKSPYALITYLIVLVLILIGFNFYFVRSVNVYVFNGYSDEYTFLDGSIYTGFDINTFTSPTIIYSGDEIVLKDYEIGYFIKDGDDFNNISVVTPSEDKDEVLLSEVLTKTEFSFTEIHKNAYFFSKKNIKNIEKLYFRISGTTLDDDNILVEIPLNVQKVTR